MVENTKEKKIFRLFIVQSTFSSENDTFTSLLPQHYLQKNAVPYSHKRVADNYVIIKRIYRFQVVQSRISNRNCLVEKYDFNTLESSTIKQINEELAYLKKCHLLQMTC